MLIANLFEFPESWLPLYAQRPYLSNDVASYDDLSEILGSIMHSCMDSIKTQRRLGWAIGGRSRAPGESHNLQLANVLTCL